VFVCVCVWFVFMNMLTHWASKRYCRFRCYKATVLFIALQMVLARLPSQSVLGLLYTTTPALPSQSVLGLLYTTTPALAFVHHRHSFVLGFFLINMKYKTQIGIQTRGYTFWNFLCAGPNPLSGDWTQFLVVFNIVLSPTLKGVTSLQKLENVWSLRQA
jgi:hypothetical protein